MIHLIVGLPGVGKTSLMTYFLKDTYFKNGIMLKNRVGAAIKTFNVGREVPLRIPDKPPIYAAKDYEVSFQINYKERFEPYLINPYYLGMPNNRMQTQFLPPYSQVFIPEIQRYADSRQSSSFPPQVYEWFQKHRHFNFTVWLDSQDFEQVDKNLRRVVGHVIEVLRMTTATDKDGNIVSTTWECREFDSISDIDKYKKGEEVACRETEYKNEGDIFRCYNSFSCEKEFLPPDEKSAGFDYLEFSRLRSGDYSEKEAIFYQEGEPEAYRAGKK